nr:coiled-coil domain-containing protein 83 isoform X2 [Danio rerio]|eukprot:XP_009303624.1 coiled-coil domain-containing protein 83 isoform X2 [Danio rerio]
MSKTTDKTSLAEAFIQFQIEIKRKEIQDIKDEIHQLEDKRQKLMKEVSGDFVKMMIMKRMKHVYLQQEELREEQAKHAREQRRRMKEMEENLEKKEREDQELLKETTQESMKLKHKQEKELEELCCKLARLQVEVEKQTGERDAWLQYKTEGSMKDQQKIQKLEKRTILSQITFHDISEHFQKSLVVAKEEQQQNLAQSLEEKIQFATTKETELLDEASITELQETEWLKEQVPIYIDKVTVLESIVQNLQEENLKHINTLSQIIDSLIGTGNEFPVQSASFVSHDTQSADENIMKKCLEETSELLNRGLYPHQTLAEAEETQQESSETTSPSTTPSDITEMFNSQANFMGPIHLGLLNERLLRVEGKACPLHPSQDQTEKWSVTTKTIKDKFQNPGKSDAPKFNAQEGVPGKSFWEEASGKTQDKLEGPCLSASLGKPQDSPGVAGRSVWGERKV